MHDPPEARTAAAHPGGRARLPRSCAGLLQTAADARALAAPDATYDNEIYAAWLAGVSSANPPNWDLYVRPAADAVSSGSTDEMFYRETNGILLYRAGLYQEAAEEFVYVGRYSSTGYSVESMFGLALAKEKLGVHSEAVGWYIDAMKAMGAWDAQPASDPYAFEAAPAALPPPTIWEIRLRRNLLRAEAEQIFKDEIDPKCRHRSEFNT